MKAEDLEQYLLDMIEEQKQAISEDSGKDSVQELQEALSSGEAIAFTARMNQLYKDQGIKDDDGNPLTVQHPEDLPAKMSWDSGGLSGTVSITPEEDRWIRANQLYGNDILGKLGFKYTDS
jgi:hypothetical protein